MVIILQCLVSVTARGGEKNELFSTSLTNKKFVLPAADVLH